MSSTFYFIQVLFFSLALGAEFWESCNRGSDCIGNLGCYARERYGSEYVCKCPHSDWVWNNISTCVREQCTYRLGWDSVGFQDPHSEKCLMRLEVRANLDQIRENVLECPGNSTFNTGGTEGWCSCDNGFVAANDNQTCISGHDASSVTVQPPSKTYRESCTSSEECAENLECLAPSAAWPDVHICTCKTHWLWNNSTKCIYPTCEYRIGWDGHVIFTNEQTDKCEAKLNIPLRLDEMEANFIGCPEHSTLKKDASLQVGECKCDTGYAPHPRKRTCEPHPGLNGK